MIILRDISLRRGPRLLFEGANATLKPGMKLALTGANGTGKSSLFAMLLGDLAADGGSIEGIAGLRIAHMEQDIAASEQTAVDYVIAGDEALFELLSRLRRQEAEEDFEGAAATHQALEDSDGYSGQRRAEALMLGLGFATSDSERPLSDFSGGWRVRLALARALMAPSDLLLLDEPTNHLDLDTTFWLRDFLRQYRGTLLLISHDRDFIDGSCDGVLHIENQGLDSYRGGYSDFEQQRAQRLAEQRAQAAKQSRRRAEIEDFVRRFRAKATKAKQAQSRLKELERMGEVAIAHESSPFEFRFPEPPRGRDPLIDLRGGAVGYDESAPLMTGVDFSLRLGDRIAVLGRNGSGKTTFLRSLCRELPLLAGDMRQSEGCRVAYFDQQQVDTLDLGASALLHLQRLSPDAREQQLRDFLGGFDFRGERADEPLAPFSGGEKARLALALLVWQKPNVLILDEPTNHLDLDMRRALEVALLAFSGAVILVSHDRHLLRSTAETFVRVADGKLQEFDGDLAAYEALVTTPAPDSSKESSSAPSPSADRKEQRRQAAAAREQRRPLEKQAAKLEKQMEKEQAALAEIDDALADNNIYAESEKNRLQTLLKAQGQHRENLSSFEEEWLQIQESLEAMTD